jgi:hypothetical protein
MGIFGRLVTGLKLARGSLAVLRDHPKLLAFPLVGGVAGLVFIAALLGGTLVGTGGESGPVLYGALFALYVGSTFIASFVTAALMHATREAFHGQEPSVRRSMAVAWRRKGTLLLWAVIAAVVGVLIRALEESNEIVARIVAVVFALGWAVMTYFVVPVIVFEDAGIRGMFSRSGGLVKELWGESLGAEAGVSIVTVLLVLAGVAVTGLAFVAIPTGTAAGLFAVLAIGAVAIVGALLIGMALTGIAKTALYVYATEDETPPYFGGMDFGR